MAHIIDFDSFSILLTLQFIWQACQKFDYFVPSTKQFLFHIVQFAVVETLSKCAVWQVEVSF